jgi:hypothetical protein
MKRTFVVCAFLSAAILIGVARGEDTNAVPAGAKPAGTPKLVFDNTVYDFGTTSSVSSVTGTFTFHNAGDALLEMKKPQPSCGCTVAGVKPESLKPGEKGELVFTVNLGNVQRLDVEKHITVPSNDPQNGGNVSLTIKAKVVPLFEADPTQVMLNTLRIGAKTNLTLHIKRVDGKSVGVTKVESTNPSFHPELVTNGNLDDSQAVIQVTVSAEGPPRQFRDELRVFTSNTNQAALAIPVLGRLVGDLSVVPEAVIWGIVDSASWTNARPEDKVRRIKITYDKPGATVELKNLVTSLSDLTVTLETNEIGKAYQVVAVLPEPPKDSERGTISFETNLASQPTVVVPVYVNVLKTSRTVQR